MKRPSTPSAPPSPARGPEPPDDGWPIPEPGDVLSYAYLWSHEADRGREEGLKDRPVAVVAAVQVVDGRTQILVVPITHSKPAADHAAIELPKTVKRDLGLDSERSWIVLSEINRFIWPGPDIRIVSGRSDPYYGAIPAGLFMQVRDAIGALVRQSRMRTIRRSE